VLKLGLCNMSSGTGMMTHDIGAVSRVRLELLCDLIPISIATTPIRHTLIVSAVQLQRFLHKSDPSDIMSLISA